MLSTASAFSEVFPMWYFMIQLQNTNLNELKNYFHNKPSLTCSEFDEQSWNHILFQINQIKFDQIKNQIRAIVWKLQILKLVLEAFWSAYLPKWGRFWIIARAVGHMEVCNSQQFVRKQFLRSFPDEAWNGLGRKNKFKIFDIWNILRYI